jgi:CRISPR-associated protein Csm2
MNQHHDYKRDTKPTQSALSEIRLKPLDANLFDKVAEDWAKAISKTKSTQARNFYDYVLNYYEKVQSGEEAFSNILPFIKMLNSKVHYAKARGHASDEFADMIKRCVSQVDSKETLETFKLFFEAVVGFSKSK